MNHMHRDFYALFDSEGPLKSKGAFRIPESSCSEYNSQGYGIFWTVQEFMGDRKKENIKKINSWAIDLDGGNKDDQLEMIHKYCYPSLLVETKNGFHVYWDAKNATVDNFEEIVSDRLVFLFKADPKARDLARILRVPGYKHLKNPQDPFEIKKVWSYPVSYTEEQMIYNFKLPKEKQTESKTKQELRKVFKADGNDLWEKVYNLDCQLALERLSGTPAVGCENITFRRVSNGNLNILVDGKSTSCWVDSSKRIGSSDNGGPTIWQWINWYHRDNKKTYEYMKDYFSELWI